MDSSRRLLSSLDLVHRVSKAATAYTIARMGVLERISGNPVGIARQTYDNVVALMAQGVPSASFNSVVGLRPGQEDRIGPLVEWYRAHGIAGRFEIAAGDDDPALGRELTRLGYFQSGHHAALVGEPDPPAAALDEPAVEQVASAEQNEDFLAA